MNKYLRQYLLISCFLISFLSNAQDVKIPVGAELDHYKQRIKQVISFLEFSFNTLGNDSTSVEEKDNILNSSYLKIFRDDKVQIEDDLDEQRKIYTYKNVQAYLRDIDYFFKHVDFTMEIVNIHPEIVENQLFFKVQLYRKLKGRGIDDDSVKNVMERFIEINVDGKTKELKIASIYTSKLNEEEELKTWWENLTPEWKDELLKLSAADAGFPNLKELIKIQTIDFSGKENITDISPLSKMTSLRHLNLAGMTISDVSPLRGLINLEYLNLNGTKINTIEALTYSGRLKELMLDNTLIDSLTVLTYFSSLTKLTLNNVQLSFAPMNQLLQLKELQISGVPLGILKEFKSLVSLEILDCSHSLIDSLDFVKNLPHIIQLNVSHTRVTDLSPLSALAKLKMLYVNNTNVQYLTPLLKSSSIERIYCDNSRVNKAEASLFMNNKPGTLVIYESQNLNDWWHKLTDEWKKVFKTYTKISETAEKEELASIVNILSIDVSGNKNIQSLEPLKALRKLSELKLNNTSIKNLEPLSSQSSLKILEFSGTEITTLSPLKGIPAIERINCDNTMVSEVEINDFRKKNPSCVIVYRSSQLRNWWLNLPGDWRKVFRNNKSLPLVPTDIQLHLLFYSDSIYAGGENIQNIESITELRTLKILMIPNNHISNLEPLKNLHELNKLDFANNPVSDLLQVSPLKNLKYLDIRNTKVKKLDPLADLKSLENLNFSGTKVKSLSPLEELVAIKSLSFSNTGVRNLKPLNKLASIKYLECFNTSISNKKIQEFQKKHPSCKVIFY